MLRGPNGWLLISLCICFSLLIFVKQKVSEYVVGSSLDRLPQLTDRLQCIDQSHRSLCKSTSAGDLSLQGPCSPVLQPKSVASHSDAVQ